MNDSQSMPLNRMPFDHAASSSEPCTVVQPTTIECREPISPSQGMQMDLSNSSLAASVGSKAGESRRGYVSRVGGQGLSANLFSVSKSLQPGGSGGGSVAVPRYRSNHLPVYPDIARRLGYEGTVILSTEVYPDGHVGSIRIRRSSGYALLDKTARETISQWTFEPGYRNGVPVIMWVDVPVTFRLTDKSVS
jgi:TonB family protein